MRLEKYGILAALLAAVMLPGIASARSMKELADWSVLPQQLNGHDVKFVMTDASSLKARLVDNQTTDFLVFTEKQGR